MTAPPGPASSPLRDIKPTIRLLGRTTNCAASASFRAARIEIASPHAAGACLSRLIFQPEDAHHKFTSRLDAGKTSPNFASK
jgi:hypothetical protein